MARRSNGGGGGWGLALVGLGTVLIGAAIADNNKRNREAAAREAELEQVRGFIRTTLSEICGAFGISTLALSFVADGNAASDGAGILVNLRWFHDLLMRHCDSVACSLSVARWVLAHEVAHHVHGDAKVPRWIRSAHSMELRADYFGGRALAHFGANISVIESVLLEIAPFVTDTHPAFDQRLRAAREGYSDYVLERAFVHSQPQA